MKILKKSFGSYETNCYILNFSTFSFVVDPGMGSLNWILEHAKNLKAILVTHGHFDHVFDLCQLKTLTQAKVYIHKDDAFMLHDDPFAMLENKCKADFLAEDNEEFDINGIKVKFLHFPGHSPGCSMILVENKLFSGDFLFKNSIGRWDFPFSDAKAMKKSLDKLKNIQENYEIFPGHGESSFLFQELGNVDFYQKYLS